jgi:predicted DNA-binding protein
MKTKIGVYLTDDVAKRLKTAVRRSDTTKSDIVNEALDRFFNRKDEKDLDGEVLHRMKGLAKRVWRIHREVEIIAETLALHIRQFMMITPPVSKIDQAAARKLGNERYEVFVKEVSKRIASDNGIVADIIGLILESHEDRFAQPVRNSAMPPNSRPSEAAAHG